MSAFIYITTAKILYIIIPHQLIKNKPQCKEVSVKQKQATKMRSIWHRSCGRVILRAKQAPNLQIVSDTNQKLDMNSYNETKLIKWQKSGRFQRKDSLQVKRKASEAAFQLTSTSKARRFFGILSTFN
jgi:hypothetical protein